MQEGALEIKVNTEVMTRLMVSKEILDSTARSDLCTLYLKINIFSSISRLNDN